MTTFRSIEDLKKFENQIEGKNPDVVSGFVADEEDDDWDYSFPVRPKRKRLDPGLSMNPDEQPRGKYIAGLGARFIMGEETNVEEAERQLAESYGT